jgi:hypothetical protein
MKPLNLILLLVAFTMIVNAQGRSILIRGGINRQPKTAPQIELPTPILVTNSANGYPEIAPGCGVLILVPINRTVVPQDISGPPTEIDGVSVRIDGIPARMYGLYGDKILLIAPPELSIIPRTADVKVSTPEGIYSGRVRVGGLAPGIYRGYRDNAYQAWPLGLYRLGRGLPQIVSDQPIPPTHNGDLTVVKVTTTGLRLAQSVEVLVDGQAVPLIVVARGLFPEQDEVAFELPEWLWGADRLVEVRILADGKPANPFWLHLPSIFLFQ